jgi:hypothetical protein
MPLRGFRMKRNMIGSRLVFVTKKVAQRPITIPQSQSLNQQNPQSARKTPFLPVYWGGPSSTETVCCGF